MDTMQRLRENMVRRQIENRGVSDKRVLEAMRSVPRHLFVPEHSAQAAYEDHPLPIGYGQTISQPYIVAVMTELCGIRGGEKVLEIGTGSGYQTAILARIAGQVYTIEVVEEIYKRTVRKLQTLGYQNIHPYLGNGYKGLPEEAPFDAIILTAAPPKVPKSLTKQLSDTGGKLVAPIGTYSQELIVLTRNGGGFDQRHITYVQFVPMVNGR
jgi:protein-L-isoaspartate(D-aspartate) O-methyltransferase